MPNTRALRSKCGCFWPQISRKFALAKAKHNGDPFQEARPSLPPEDVFERIFGHDF
jgi:hypothetical protein